jgi:glycosyltransferase involved in cell wall biosynthesis
MRVVLISDTFPPLRTSGAVQIRDLAREFAHQGHSLCVLLPATGQCESWKLEEFDGAQLLRLKAPHIKDINLVRRGFAEVVMPFAMLWNFRKSPLAKKRWDAVVWYSPSIFHGPLVSALKKSTGCKSYLIIRDVFPEWARDMGLMGPGLPYLFFSFVARYQYSVADMIGVQSHSNLLYFSQLLKVPGWKLEVLENWLGKPAQERCSIRVNQTILAGRKIFVYAGNMGVAQGMDIFLDLAEKLISSKDIGFLFVGRGSDKPRLKALTHLRQLDNVLFFDEIEPDEIPDLYAQCSVGIVALDTRHKFHNIPGKFLTYMQSGLPVLAKINAGNDLAQLIRDENVGKVCEANHVEDLLQLAEELLNQIKEDKDLSARCINLFKRKFAVKNTVKQIVGALSQNLIS